MLLCNFTAGLPGNLQVTVAVKHRCYMRLAVHHNSSTTEMSLTNLPRRTYIAMLASFTGLCDASSPAAASFWEQHYTVGGPVHIWVLLFIVSKLFELGDTLFLAVLGKPIIFLHWCAA